MAYTKIKSARNRRNYAIPEMWLVGAIQTRQRDGMSYRDALVASIKHWIEQEKLEELRISGS